MACSNVDFVSRVKRMRGTKREGGTEREGAGEGRGGQRKKDRGEEKRGYRPYRRVWLEPNIDCQHNNIISVIHCEHLQRIFGLVVDVFVVEHHKPRNLVASAVIMMSSDGGG